MRPIVQIQSQEVMAQARSAEAFLRSHAWCREIREGYVAWAVAGVLGVFQFHITPARPGVDEVLWVITGDLPPAYLVLDDAPTWQAALQAYVDEMERWVDAVRSGRDTVELIPVNAPPTAANATVLAKRLAFIRERLVSTDPTLLESDV